MNTVKELMKIWKQERDAAFRSQDVETFKEFYKKWQARGFYRLPLPANDKVIEISLRKCLYHMKGATQAEKDAAAKWLHDHGCDTDLA